MPPLESSMATLGVTMRIGLLWFDGDPKTDLVAKIEGAARYYSEKYGRQPTVCLINPRMIDNSLPVISGIRVDTSKSILVNHFFLGVE